MDGLRFSRIYCSRQFESTTSKKDYRVDSGGVENVRIDVIKSSFKSCALNIAIDGSEDELIHCFKENQPCSTGLQRLKAMANTTDDEREDPFVSLSDSYVEQEAINELDSDDENDEIIDISRFTVGLLLKLAYVSTQFFLATCSSLY